MVEKDKLSISKFMCLVLRHAPEKAGVTLDLNGWADVDTLLDGINRTRNVKVTFSDLCDIVQTDDKQRYKFNDDCTKIRANQGHSISVDVELKEQQPPDVLYHGTASRFIDSIKTDGLIAKSRLYTHLSVDKETAVKVGKRHGEPIILTIDAFKMYEDGFKFYISENDVWLTECVPAEYIID